MARTAFRRWHGCRRARCHAAVDRRWPEQQRRTRATAFCASLFRQDIEPMPGRPFLVQGTVRRLPGLGVIWATAAGLISRRRPEHVTNDDIMIDINLDGARSPPAARPRARDPARRDADRERRRDRRDDHSGTEPLHQPAHSGAGAQPRHADQDPLCARRRGGQRRAAAAASLPARAARPGDRAHARSAAPRREPGPRPRDRPDRRGAARPPRSQKAAACAPRASPPSRRTSSAISA